jgi:hypothetical protein
MGERGDTAPVLQPLRHFALFAALYVAAQVAALALLSGVQVPLRAVIVGALAALGTWLVDRSGPWPGQLDRGDLRAQPDRVRFLRQHALLARVLSIAALVAATALALQWGVYATIVPLSVIGLLCYSRWGQPGRRIKDRLGLKTLAIAGSITALAAALVHVDAQVQWSVLWPGVIVLLLRISADAMRCDIDDAKSDARHGTRTVANVFGIQRTWRLALAIDVLGAAVVLALGSTIGWLAALVLALVPLGASIMLFSWQPNRSRDLVDALAAMAIALAWGVIVCVQGV